MGRVCKDRVCQQLTLMFNATGKMRCLLAHPNLGKWLPHWHLSKQARQRACGDIAAGPVCASSTGCTFKPQAPISPSTMQDTLLGKPFASSTERCRSTEPGP